MATLYELTGIYRELYALNIDDIVKETTLESMDWQEDFEQKAEDYVKVIKNFETDKSTIDDEIQRLRERKAMIDNQIKRIKNTLKDAMVQTNNTKIKTALFNISVANNKASVVVNEQQLPKKYFRKKVEVTPDKETLYDLLKKGKTIKGAELKQTQSLRIR